MNNPQGWLNVYKPIGITSFVVVKRIKKYFNINKIGHGGTLDPLAEGVLPIAIGKTTKLIPFINTDIKEYEFEVKWGIQTSTDDAEGDIIHTSDIIPTNSEITEVLNKFKGKILQKPPKASAIKINGKRAYLLLRNKENFEVKAKTVYLYSSEILKSNNSNLCTKFKIKCGKGFYVRSYARDLAKLLHTRGHISSLKRTQVGKFSCKNANLLDDLLKVGQRISEFKDFHTSVSMLDDILAYEINDQKSLLSISQGKLIKIDLNKLINPFLSSTVGKNIFLTDRGKVLSFGKLDGDLFKPNKVLI